MLRLSCIAFCCALACAAVADADVEVVAYRGAPFGVGRITFTRGENPQDPLSHLSADTPSAAFYPHGDAVFYPVLEHRLRKHGEDLPWVAYFLFSPAETVTLTLPLNSETHTVPARVDKNAFEEMRDKWWLHYSSRAKRMAREDRYPPELDQYLSDMLARRMGKATPTIKPASTLYSNQDETTRLMTRLTGTESIRLAMQKDELLKTSEAPVADQPLPVATSPPAVQIPDVKEDVAVEPIAMAVPPECFYLRFGSYNNFSWFRQRVDEWGTSVRDMLSARAFDYHVSEKLQQQLQIGDTELARLLGPAVIKDVAIIGSDPFVREGAGIGILFHASNNALLRTNLELQRTQCAAAEADVTLEEKQFPARKTTGTFLSSPDNRVRSFYVVHGDFHLVTTSRAIATRFVDVLEGKQPALGGTKEFRYTRSVTPLDRNDQAFLYLSDSFFRSFVDPAFRIEMTRRARSENQIQLVQFARMAAKSEGIEATSINDLIDAQLLPPHFGSRVDGSMLAILDGQIVDTVRGRRGFFAPVADVGVTSVTKSEVTGYQSFSRAYQRLWRKMDPATVAIHRTKEGDRERLVMDLHVFPFPASEYGILAWLAPKKSTQTLKLPDNVLILAEGDVFGYPVFAGVVDFQVPFTVENGVVKVPEFKERDQPYFIGSRKKGDRGLFDNNKSRPEGEYVKEDVDWLGTKVAYSRGDIAVFSNKREVIESVFDKLEVVDAEREVQYRVHFNDLAKAQAAALSHAYAWSQANKIGTGNAMLLNQIASQFRLSPDEVPEAVDAFYLGSLQCPFGGDYTQNRVMPEFTDHKVWSSTSSVDWKDYRMPLINRIRGGEFELTIEGTTLRTRVDLLLDAD